MAFHNVYSPVQSGAPLHQLVQALQILDYQCLEQFHVSIESLYLCGSLQRIGWGES